MNREDVIKEVAETEQVDFELIDAIANKLDLVDDDIGYISINGSVLEINSMEYLITKDYDEAVELAVESMFELVKEFYGTGTSIELSEFATKELINIIGERIDLSEYAIEGDDGEEYIPNDIWELTEEHGYDKLELIITNATSSDYREIAEYIVRIDGVGVTLASYDHDEIELHNGNWLFRTI